MSLRDIKTEARAALHEAMKVPAYYIVAPNASPVEYVELSVRVHSLFRALGDIQSNQVGLAEREEMVPRLVFLVEECVPARGAYVMISETEGYRIDTVQPRDGLTVTAFVIPLSTSQLSGMPYPEEA